MNATLVLQSSIVAAAMLTSASPLLAMQDCSDARVRRLADRGETIAAIAEKCDLDEEEIEEILDAELDDVGPDVGGTRSGLPSGTPVSACACYGFVTLGYQQSYAGCQSGIVVATMCGTVCPAGGYQWHNVCQ